MYKLLYPALGSGQRLLYRLGSGLGLVLVLVCAYCSACADLCDSGPESSWRRDVPEMQTSSQPVTLCNHGVGCGDVYADFTIERSLSSACVRYWAWPAIVRKCWTARLTAFCRRSFSSSKDYVVPTNVSFYNNSSNNDERETAFLFQRLSILMQRFNVLLHDFFSHGDCPE